MYSRFRLIFLFVVAAPLLAASVRGDVAPAPQLIVQAVTALNLTVVTWVDHADGPVTRDPDQAAALQAMFANTTWKFFDNNKIEVSHPQNGKPGTFLTVDDRSPPSHIAFFFHERAKDGAVYDGYVLRNATDPTKGFAYFTIQRRGDLGTSTTSFIVLPLSFAPPATP
jgi:hypothetical protein